MKTFKNTIVLAAALALALAPTSIQARQNTSRRVQRDGSNAAVGRSAKRSLQHNPATATPRRLAKQGKSSRDAKQGKSSRDSNEGIGLQHNESEVHAYVAEPTPEAEDINKSSLTMPMQMSMPFAEMGLGLEIPMSMPAETDNELADEDITTTLPTESETVQSPEESSEPFPSSTSASDTMAEEASDEIEVPDDMLEDEGESSKPTIIDTVGVQKMTNASDIKSTFFMSSLFGAFIMML